VRKIHEQSRILQEAGLTKQNKRAASQAKQYNKGKKEKKFKVGEKVRVNMGQGMNPQTKKLARVWKGPYTILKRNY